MNIFEIFLNKLADKNELYNELTMKLNIDSGMNINAEFLKKFLSDATESSEIRLYVSNESVHNDDIDEVISIFRNAAKENSNINLKISEEEFLNIIDKSETITSEVKPRSLVHRDGDFHPTVHIWIIKRMDMGVYVLLQKRAAQKEIYPDCYDVSAAGHVVQGDDYRATAVRELYEEIGVNAAPEELEFIGIKRSFPCDAAGGTDIKDNEFSAVYLYRNDIDIETLKLQESEVSEVCWTEIDELLSVMGKDNFKHCIFAEELQMIKNAVY